MVVLTRSFKLVSFFLHLLIYEWLHKQLDLAEDVLDLPTPDGWKAELTWMTCLNTKTVKPVNTHQSTNRA